MGTGRVLDEAASLGLSAIEAGPEGFLPSDPADALRVLGEHDLSLVGDSCRSCCTAPNDAGASSPRSSGRKFRIPEWPPDVWILTGAEPG